MTDNPCQCGPCIDRRALDEGHTTIILRAKEGNITKSGTHVIFIDECSVDGVGMDEMKATVIIERVK